MKNYLLVISFIGLFVYLRTLAPTIVLHDSGDMASSAYLLGIPHPPGYPLYNLVGKLFSFILPVGNIAWRLNLISAIAAISAAVLLYCLTKNLTNNDISAVIAAGTFLSVENVWLQANITEKYTLNILFTATLLYLLIRLYKAPKVVLFYLTIFTFALALTHHLQTLFLVPSILYIFFVRRHLLWQCRFGVILLIATLPLFLYLYLPIRALDFPAVNWGDPKTIGRFIEHISAKEYHPYFSTFPTVTDIPKHILLVLMQVKWPVFILGIVGMSLHLLRNRSTFVVLFLVVLCDAFHTLRYKIHNIEDYYIPTYFCIAFWVGYCIYYALTIIKRGWLRVCCYAVFIAMVGFSAWESSKKANHRYHYFAYDYGMNILRPLSEHAIAFVKGDTLMFPLWYLRYVERVREDVKLIDIFSLAHEWYLKQLKILYPTLNINIEQHIPNKDKLSKIYSRFDELFDLNYKNSPIYLPFDEMLTDKYKLIPAGILHRVIKKEDVGEVNIGKPCFFSRYIHDKRVYKDERTQHNIHNYAVAYNNLANFYKEKGSYSTAFSLLGKALEIDPKNVNTHYEIAMLYKDLGHLKKAKERFIRLIKLAPRHAQGYFGLGLVYKEEYKFAQAIKYLLQAIEYDPKQPFLYNHLAEAYFKLGDYKRAKESFQQALQIDPTNEDARRNLLILEKIM